MADMIAITPRGFERLKDELKRLKSVDRPTVIQDIAEARKHGDLSENAEYHSARERQSFIEGRILELEDKISRMHVFQGGPGPAPKVQFGTVVTLKDVSDDSKGEKKTYKIVGDLEADLKESAISIASPLGTSLINKAIGDIVTVTLPRGEKEYEVINIIYAT